MKRISRSHFKISKTEPYARNKHLCFAMICKFLEDFWEEMIFIKGLVKFGEIRNIEDLFCF